MSFYDAWKERQARRTWVFVCICVFGLGSLLAWIANTRRDNARVGLTETKDFKLFVLTEGNPKVRSRYASQKPANLGPPVLVTKDRDGDREWFPGFADVMFIQKYQFMGKDEYAPVWALIKGPDALDKTRRWLKERGYKDWNFQLKWTNLNEYRTEPVQPTSGDSEIVITAYYEAGGRHYMWSGSHVYDLSEGFTGNAKGQEEAMLRNVHLMTGIAK